MEQRDFNPDDYFDKGLFLVDKMAGQFMAGNDVLTFNDNQTMLIYNSETGVWVDKAEITIKNFVRSALGVKTKRSLYEETLFFIKASTYFDRKNLDANKNKICLENGVYNLITHEFSEFDPDLFMTVKVPVKYDKDAGCPKIIDFLYQVLNPDAIPQVQEFLGYCLWRSYPFHKAFIFTGCGSNGKSTLLNVMRSMIGGDNVTNISLQNIDGNRFSSALMYNKLANLCNDIPRKSLFNTGIFKQLCGGDAVYAEEKFKSGCNFINYAKLCFSCNQLPETHDDSDAFFRRIVIVDFPNVFSGETRDEALTSKLTTPEELSGLFNWAIIGLERLFQQRDFSICASTQDTARDYKRRSSPISAFIMDCCKQETGAETVKDDFYNAYTEYCNDWDMTALDKSLFGKKLRVHAPFIQEKRGQKAGARIHSWTNVVLVKAEAEKNDNPVLSNYLTASV